VKDLVDKAEVLVEALPYMRRFRDRTIVIKYGGHAMSDADLSASFAVDVVLLKTIGTRPVIVHGGGPQIAHTLKRLGKQSTFVDGLRVTDEETMEVVEMVLGGKINREIVELVQQGADARLASRAATAGCCASSRSASRGTTSAASATSSPSIRASSPRLRTRASSPWWRRSASTKPD